MDCVYFGTWEFRNPDNKLHCVTTHIYRPITLRCLRNLLKHFIQNLALNPYFLTVYWETDNHVALMHKEWVTLSAIKTCLGEEKANL